MTIISTPTVLTGSMILGAGNIYTGGVTLAGSADTDTVYIPLGSFHTLTTDYTNSMGSSLDLSGAIANFNNFQTPVASEADWSGLVVGGILDIIGTYIPTLENKHLIENVVGSIGAEHILAMFLATYFMAAGHMIVFLA
jgi:hypothetical protein